MSLLLPWLSSFPDRSLRTERLVLEAPRRGHYRQWASVREASRHHLEPFEPQWAWDELSRAAYRRRLHRYNYERRERIGHAYLILRVSDGAMVGGVTLSNVRRGVTQTASVGYWIGQPFVRQGYASFSFEKLKLHRVEAACMPRNSASIGVLERAGFRREGVARRYLKINGEWEDHVLYARLAEDAAVRSGHDELSSTFRQHRESEGLPLVGCDASSSSESQAA
jgi:ribosomal-protein-alanine N-acetyltransferase